MIKGSKVIIALSGGFRNSEREVQPLAANFWVATPTFGHAGSPN